jgi:uncharacterized protein
MQTLSLSSCRSAITEDAAQDSGIELDFSAVLVKPATLYEQRLGNDWLLFAPDWLGWPVLVSDSVHSVINCFSVPTPVGIVFSRLSICNHESALSRFTNVIAALEDAGLLRGKPATLPYVSPVATDAHPLEDINVWLHLTNACNLTCSYCFVRNKDGTQMKDSVCDATADVVARTAIQHKLKSIVLKFAGGEPTLCLPLIERFRSRLETALADSGIRCYAALLTNGTVVNEPVLDFLSRPDSSISISVDGYGATHDVFRRTKAGAPTWTRILKNIELLQKRGFSPFIMATVTQQTRNGLPDLVRWILSNHLRTKLSVVREQGAVLSPDYNHEMAAAFEETFRMLESERISFDPRNDLKICELHFDRPAWGVACAIGTSHIVIKTDGTLVDCPMNVHHQGEPPGDDIIAACSRTFPLDDTESRTSANGRDCVSCQWYPVCAHGCPVYNERNCGYPFAKSTLCEFYKRVIPAYLELIGRKLQEHTTSGFNHFVEGGPLHDCTK